MKLLAVAAVLVVFAACAGQDLLTGDRLDVGVVTVVFTASPARVQVGSPVQFRIRLSNNGGKTEQLVSSSAQVYDFWAKAGRREVWRWSSGRVFVQSVTTTDIQTQSSVTYTEIWRPSETGRFTVYGEIKAAGYAGPMKGTVIVE